LLPDLNERAGVLSLLVGAMKTKKLEFSSHTGNLALMRKYVRKFLDGYPFSEKERMLMVLGVDEACTNIIRHAYQLRDMINRSHCRWKDCANAFACVCAITASKSRPTKCRAGPMIGSNRAASVCT